MVLQQQRERAVKETVELVDSGTDDCKDTTDEIGDDLIAAGASGTALDLVQCASGGSMSRERFSYDSDTENFTCDRTKAQYILGNGNRCRAYSEHGFDEYELSSVINKPKVDNYDSVDMDRLADKCQRLNQLAERAESISMSMNIEVTSVGSSKKQKAVGKNGLVKRRTTNGNISKTLPNNKPMTAKNNITDNKLKCIEACTVDNNEKSVFDGKVTKDSERTQIVEPCVSLIRKSHSLNKVL